MKVKTVWVLAKRELRLTLFGSGIYLALLTSLVISSIILRNHLAAVGRDGLLITASPLAYPLFIAAGVCAVYLALASVTSIARERDMQTLELLFYGPVDHTSYIFAKYLKAVLSYLFIAILLVCYFGIASLTSNLGLSFKFLEVLVLSLFLSSCVITFGIFMSTLAESVRTAVLLLLGIVGGLIAIQIALEVLMTMGDNLAPSLLYLRKTLSVLHAIVKWVSPFYYLDKGMEAISLGSVAKYAVSGISSTIYSAAFLLLSILALKIKGVRKTNGE
ncbi:MAG: ABC transporter permease subunit [Desulfobacterales bacterium]|nr:MAG: ABC transporter permease subunit [Desulfobacterales bacterium]